MDVDNAGSHCQSSPPSPHWTTLRCPGWQLLLKLRNPERPLTPPAQIASFCVDCTVAPTCNGITTAYTDIHTHAPRHAAGVPPAERTKRRVRRHHQMAASQPQAKAGKLQFKVHDSQLGTSGRGSKTDFIVELKDMEVVEELEMEHKPAAVAINQDW
eukprot:365035-Chlamydomonas_euryale.AAC.3